MVNFVKAARVALLTALGTTALCSAVLNTSVQAADLRVIPLRSVDNQGGQLELRGQAGQLQFRIPLETGAKVQDARLRLVYQTTDAVVAERSKMWVYLNQQSIAQLPLSGSDDALRADIVLPPELLTPGQNVLSLWAQQENRQGCDADSSAALWTRLDPANSYLALETQGADRQADLSDLTDPASFIGAGSERIEILTPSDRTEGTLKAGALVAQGFALRMPEAAIAVRHRTAAAPAMASGHGSKQGKVLVGRAGSLLGLIADLPDIRGPYIGLRDLANGAGKVLIISGRTDREVQSAATAFADPTVRLPAARDWTVEALPPSAIRNRAVQEPGGTYRFADLRATSGGISNGTEPRTGLEINLPADTLPAGGRKFLLELDYAYAANLAPNSVVNVLVNGRYASMIAMNQKEGAMVRGQRVLLPIDMLRPGVNTVAFEPMIGSDPAVGCLVRPGGGKSVAISGESRITIPEMARVASLPNLQLFASGGFPYVGGDPRREFEVMLTSGDDGTIGGAWTLLAKLAQTAGHPVANFGIGRTQGAVQGDIVMIGPLSTLDKRFAAVLPSAARTVRDVLNPASALFDPGPLFLGETAQAPKLAPLPSPATPAVIKAGVTDIEPTDLEIVRSTIRWTSELSREFRRTLWPDRYTDDTTTNLAAVDEGSAMMASFESPLKPQTTVTLITAATEEGVEAGVAALIRPALWDRLSGGTAAWNSGTMAMQAWPAEGSYRLGDVPENWRQRVLFVNALFSGNPVGWALLALMGLLSLTWLTHLALGKRDGN